MLAEISWREFLEWLQFAQLEPFDEEREDQRVGALRATIVNVNRDIKKRPTPFVASDFTPLFGDSVAIEKPKQTWQQMKSIGKMMAVTSSKRR
jgi:hypothetical protein